MQIAKKIPMEDPMVLNGLRAAYVLSNLIILGIYLYIRTTIKAKKGMDRQLPCHIQTADQTNRRIFAPA
jgi:hypothetical protein